MYVNTRQRLCHVTILGSATRAGRVEGKIECISSNVNTRAVFRGQNNELIDEFKMTVRD